MLDEVTLDVIARIKVKRLKDTSQSTCNRYLQLVRSILRMACYEWERTERVPKVKLFQEPEGRVRFLTPDQVQALLHELPAHLADMALFALQTGLRKSNVTKLEWSAVDLAKCHAWVSAGQSKNRKAIAVPLNQGAIAVLQRQLGKHPVRVFSFAGKPIADAGTLAWRKALKRAGIEDFRWHDLRHTWATMHRMGGTATHELQQLGGWKTGAMVERYAHLSSDHLATAAARLDSVPIGYDLATVAKKETV